MTVQEALASNCSTGCVAGISRQVIAETRILAPGILTPFSLPQVHPAHPNVHLLLQRAAVGALMPVLLARPGRVLVVNSCFRPLPEQLAVHQWYIEGRCGITLAARPGVAAPHTLGIALDVQDSEAWRLAFEKHGWFWQGVHDPAHYQFTGVYEHTLARVGVKAAQALLNRHGAHRVAEDGEYGPLTEAALLSSPASGWPG